MSARPFDNLYRHGLARVAVCIPQVRVASVEANTEHTLALAEEASQSGAALALFPEMGLTAYSNDDLFQQDALLDAVEAALRRVLEASAELIPVLLVGAPLRLDDRLYNCAFVIHRGLLLGVVPKSYIPGYREFYEPRQFASGLDALSDEVTVAGQVAPFGTDLIFEAEDLRGFKLHVEICEDLWAPLSPSSFAALAGATVIANLSASNITVGKADYRRKLCAAHSGKCVSAYLYSSAGTGESTTDLAWDGHALIYENADLLAESKRFSMKEHWISADIDLERLRQERTRLTTFHESAARHQEKLRDMRRVRFELGEISPTPGLHRPLERFPFVPNDPREHDERCFEAYNIQVQGLAKRLQATGIQKLVIGVSGGLDSTQALLVACRTMDLLGLPRTNILGFTMPGFATSARTKSSAWRLMEAMGITAREIDIRPSCERMLEDLEHPYARGENVFDTTFENVQAGERTSHLFRLANHHQGLVLGTGDLSELALGWATFGVGDQMSHYNVNGSVPKTLIQHLIRWLMSQPEASAEEQVVLEDILGTEISPELVPGDDDTGEPAQHTESVIGPYDLQDFHLYYVTRFGFRPSKVAFLAHEAWKDIDTGRWPPGFPEDRRQAFDLPTIKKWLRVFLWRFFQTSQFKRSTLPNGPKVGSGGSLSPRGDWRAPSDSEAKVWLDELDAHVPD